MRRIAIIGASYLQYPLIVKAKQLGYETHVFAWKNGDVGEKVADFFYPISITKKEQILEVCRSIKINGIVSIASDLAVITVNYIAKALGLIGNSIESTLISTNKYEMRKALEENGDPIPQYREVAANQEISFIGLNYPIIVKPIDRSGSRGVSKVYEESNMNKAVEKAISQSFDKKAIVEEYIDGKEYSIESISYRCKHFILAYTEKFTTGEPHFVETGHMEPAELDDTIRKKIEQIVIHALNTLKIENGASHTEIKIDTDGNIWIIEIGARMGGDLIGSDLVMISTGVDYLRAVIDIAMGNEPDLRPISSDICRAQIKYILSKRDVEEFELIRKKSPEKILKIVGYHPDNICSFSDSSERMGGVFIERL